MIMLCDNINNDIIIINNNIPTGYQKTQHGPGQNARRTEKGEEDLFLTGSFRCDVGYVNCITITYTVFSNIHHN